MLSPIVFKYLKDKQPSDFMKDTFPAMLKGSESLYAYRTAEYIKDMGTIDRYKRVKKDFSSGKVRRMSKKNKRPAIFIDRDGTLIKHVPFLHKPEDLDLFEFSSSALNKINKSDYISLLATNQPVVARNLCDLATLKQIHNKLETLLGAQGIYLDDIFFCPHHPDKGFPEENPEYKVTCNCRKPNTGMIEKAEKRYNLNIQDSWFIGDTTTDIQTGKNAGMSTILVRTGEGGKDRKYSAIPDFIFDNIKESVDFILEGRKDLDDISANIARKLDMNRARNIILVGGPARSGKTTFVKCLENYLKKRRKTVSIVSLDNWLLSADERTGQMTVRDRYKYADIGSDIEKLLTGKRIETHYYDPYLRTVSRGNKIMLQGTDCLIIEGVPALDIEYLRNISDICIYCEIEENKRYKRFVNFYKYKGFSDDRIEKLYHKRITDEVEIIEKSKTQADYILTFLGK